MITRALPSSRPPRNFRPPRPLLVAALAATLLAVAGCAGDSVSGPGDVTPTEPPAPPPVPPPAPNPTATGAIVVTISGLNGASADLVLTGPGGFSRAITASSSVTGLVAGRYTLTARPVVTNQGTLTPVPASQTIDIGTDGVPVAITITYAAATGVVVTTVSGLPAGAPAAITLTSPTGEQRLVTATTTLTPAMAGRWSLTAEPAQALGHSWRPQPAQLEETLAAGDTARLPVQYAIATGGLAVAITGLPAGVSGDVTITGPGGFTRSTSGTITFTGVAPGDYTVRVGAITHGGITYAVTPATRVVTVAASLVAAPVPVAYEPPVGRLAIAATGLPGNLTPTFTLSGPGTTGTTRPLTGAGVVNDLEPGSYTITAATLSSGATTYTPSPGAASITIARGLTTTTTFAYTASGANGSLTITVGGLPTGASGDLLVAGPGGFSRTLSASQTLGDLAPGRYTITARPVSAATGRYNPSPSLREVDVTSGAAASAVVTYARIPTVVDVTIEGLPTGSNADVTLTRPNGSSVPLTVSSRLSDVDHGRWRLTAQPVSVGGATYEPTPTTDERTVSASDTIAFSVEYRLNSGGIAVAVLGLPAGAAGSVLVTGPAGFSRALSATTTLTNLQPGSYTVTASAVSAGGRQYLPSPTTRSVTVTASQVAAAAPVTYAAQVGHLDITASGLPPSLTPTFTVTGPGTNLTVSGPRLLDSLAVGSYTVTTSAIISGGTTYTPVPTTRTVTVTVGATTSAAFTFGASGTPGVMSLTVTGLPTGTAADIAISGPGGFSQVVSATTTLTGLAPGQYTLIIRNVRAAAGTFGVTPGTRTVDVPAGGSAPTTVTYAALPARVQVPVSGLPGGSSAAITLVNPAGGTSSVTASTTITPAAAGRWRLNASAVPSGGNTYTPTPVSYDQTVLAGDTLDFPVVYALSTGSIAVSVTGLPGGTSGAVTVTGPGGYSQSVTATTTLTNLQPGSYTVTASAVSAGGLQYLPSPATRTVSVTASLVAVAAPVAYAAQAGSMAITLAGLPTGTAGDLTVTGPGGYSQVVTSTTTLSNLAAGSYTLTIRNVRAPAGTFGASPATRSVSVTAGATAATTVTYAALPAVVNIPVSGLPGGTAASLSLINPSGGTSSLTASTTINPAATGRWRVNASAVQSGGNSYTPSPASYDQTVLAGDTLNFPVTYALSTGAIAITVSGLPTGATGNVTVTGPGGYAQAVTATTTLTNLQPGSYTVTAANRVHNGITWAPSPTTRSVTVTASLVAVAAPVAYTGQFGRLTISASGLPGGVTPSFTLTGPVTRSLTGTGTTDSLPSGSYTLTAATLTSGSTTYTPSPASTSVTITTGGTASQAVAYTSSGGGGSSTPNLLIDNVYVTQAVQNWAGTAPIVVGRDALVRVFVRAEAANTARPDVRVRIYENASLISTLTIPATPTSVPTSISEGTLSASWNVVVPAANVRAGMRVLADLDPANTLGEADRTDNVWPRDGTPRSLTMASVPAFSIRLVPVITGALQGNVTEANKDNYLVTARRIFPLRDVTVSVRAPFTSSVSALQSSGGGWSTVLNELNALRAADGAPGDQHYYGVVKVSYGSGYAGLGYVPGRTAMGWDNFPSADPVAAHELGHNFARPHAPCGVSGESGYPYSGGVTGQWGWNAATNTLVAPTATDIMGYCNNQWTSDWTWQKVIDWRSFAGFETQAGGVGEGLLVWGEVVNGQVRVEPAFRVRARPTAPPRLATHQVTVLDAAGAPLVTVPIAAERVDHVEGAEVRHFAVVIPWSEGREAAAAAVAVGLVGSPFPEAVRERDADAVAGRGGVAGEQVAPTAAPEAAVTPAGAEVRVEWNDRAYPLAVIREAGTGVILGFARRSGHVLRTEGRGVEVVLSDGVRSRPAARR